VATVNIAGIMSQIYELLEPLSPEERKRVISATMALFGEGSPARWTGLPGDIKDLKHEEDSDLPTDLGKKARRWITQTGLTTAQLEEVFHFEDGGTVDLIAMEISGSTNKEQTANAYLLCGARSLLQGDEPNVQNKDAVEYCKHVGCYDKNNHTYNRNSLGNKIIGTVGDGFTLPAPGLKAAAAVIKAMAVGKED